MEVHRRGLGTLVEPPGEVAHPTEAESLVEPNRRPLPEPWFDDSVFELDIGVPSRSFVPQAE